MFPSWGCFSQPLLKVRPPMSAGLQCHQASNVFFWQSLQCRQKTSNVGASNVRASNVWTSNVIAPSGFQMVKKGLVANGLDLEWWDLKSGSPTIWNSDKTVPFLNSLIFKCKFYSDGNSFFFIHLSYSFNFTVVYFCQIMGGIPPPSGGIVGKNRITRII